MVEKSDVKSRSEHDNTNWMESREARKKSFREATAGVAGEGGKLK
jgi:hypothetical protein